MASDGQRPSYLLLLPPPPSPVSWDTLSAAYRPPITSALRKLAAEIRRAKVGSVLDVALPIPQLLENHNLPRSALYASIQTLVSGVYKLVCVVAATENINVEDIEGIDVRVLTLAYQRGNDEAAGSADTLGPVISLLTLANCQRGYDCVIAVESEEGEEILRQFSVIQDGRFRINRVPGGSVLISEESSHGPDDSAAVAKPSSYTSVVLGGTFDHMHIGHKLLLTMFAFLVAGKEAARDEKRVLTIGITGDELLKDKKYRELLESWDQRQEIVLEFLRTIMDFRPGAPEVKKDHFSDPGPNGHAIHAWLSDHLVIKFVEIGDPFGPTITDESISAMVLSAETRSGGKAVNDKRREKGWHELDLFEVDVLDAEESGEDQQQDETFQAKLSSTTIRKALSERAQLRSKV